MEGGERIRVWGNKQLPTFYTYKAVSPRLFLQSDTRVSELIDAATTSWKTSIIDALFLPHEAEKIKSIPLSSRLPTDRLVWTETSNGLFFVSSSYNLVVKASQHANRGESSEDDHIHHFWRKVWHLPIPHKVHHFGWRACHDALPTKANLRKRQIVQDDICDSCRMESESVGISYGAVRKLKRHWATLKWQEGRTLRDVARSKICCGHC